MGGGFHRAAGDARACRQQPGGPRTPAEQQQRPWRRAAPATCCAPVKLHALYKRALITIIITAQRARTWHMLSRALMKRSMGLPEPSRMPPGVLRPAGGGGGVAQ